MSIAFEGVFLGYLHVPSWRNLYKNPYNSWWYVVEALKFSNCFLNKCGDGER
jgi:hypothetical protein